MVNPSTGAQMIIEVWELQLQNIILEYYIILLLFQNILQHLEIFYNYSLLTFIKYIVINYDPKLGVELYKKVYFHKFLLFFH